MPRSIRRPLVATLTTVSIVLSAGLAAATPGGRALHPPPVRTLCVVDAGDAGARVERMHDFAVDAADLGALFRLRTHADAGAADRALATGRCDATVTDTVDGPTLAVRDERFPAGFADQARALLTAHVTPTADGSMLSLNQPGR